MPALGPALTRRVARLEADIALFRSTCWRSHVSARGAANELLHAYQFQHALSQRFDEILSETADFSRLVQTRESQQINAALGILTVLGLPLGAALGILQDLGDQNPWHLTLALVAAVLTAGLVLTTRYGRMVLASLRGTGRNP